MFKRTVSLLFAVVLLGGLLPLVAAAQPTAPIEPDLLARLQAEGAANLFVKMSVEADLSAAYALDWAARGEYVWNALNEVAGAAQAPVLDFCLENGLDCTTMLTTNAVFVRGATLARAQDLARLPGVAYLRLERILQVPDPVAGQDAGIQGFRTEGVSPSASVAWGIIDTNADLVWDLGFQGGGIKVANIDTGVQWNHPALDQSFACPGNPYDSKCWSDPSNVCGGSACDNNGHGTHTMGTMVADDDPALTYIAGMAPAATWIACKGCESSSCSEYALNACADWILAPGGNTANRPNVVNNSWGGGGGDPWYQGNVIAWRAAGIFPAFSAGNNGSGCWTLGDPGGYQESFATAAHDSGRNIASFSSRGPSDFGHDPYTKPNISSPGVNVCSTVPTNGWNCGYSGTSMASPHTAGAVALIWSACPGYTGQIDATFQLLQDNTDGSPAGNCGAPPDGEGNYTFGYGYLNVLTAVQACSGVGQPGWLAGYVTDQNGNPLSGSTVLVSDGSSAMTDGSGYYSIELAPGTYSATVSKADYSNAGASNLVISANQVTTRSFKQFYLGEWVNQGALCFDWNRFDGEYYAGTGKAYFLGGRSGTSTIGDIYSFNPAGGACADTGANMTYPISNYTIAVLNFSGTDNLCTFGGRDASGAMLLKVQCYNPNTNAVTVKADLPAVFTGYLPGGVAVVNNKAYIFGGFRSDTTPYHIANTYEYNPATNGYTAKGDLSMGRGYMFTAVSNGKVYAFGGDTYDGAGLVAQTRAERFDPVAGTWNDAAVADLPSPSGEGRAFGFDSNGPYGYMARIILVGGGQWSSDTAEAMAYDVIGNRYKTAFPDLKIERRDHAGFFVSGANPRMWVVGGYSAAAGYGQDNPPYAPAEYFSVLNDQHDVFLPAMLRVVQP